MRDLTVQEQELIAGGCDGCSDTWYNEAFEWLETGMDWISDIFGGSDYDDAINAGQDAGNIIDGYEEMYDQEMIDQGA